MSETENDSLISEKKFRSSLTQAIALPLALSFVVCIIFAQQISMLLNETRLASQSEDVKAMSNKVFRLVVEVETASRGYLLTRDKIFLEPLQNAKSLVSSHLLLLSNMVSDNSKQYILTQSITSKFKPWIESLENSINQTKSSKATMTAGVIARRPMMLDLRKDFDSLIENESRLLASRRVNSEEQSQQTLYVTLTLSTLFGLLLAYFGHRQLTRLSKSYLHAMISLEEAKSTLEDKVIARTAELAASNRELESFCYSVSHDLRAPLRGIDGFSQALIEDYGSKFDETGTKYLGFVRQGVQKMGVLIDELLSLSRLTRNELKISHFDISEMAQSIDQEMRLLYPKRKVEFTNIPTTKVNADTGYIRIALQNLIANAWKFTSAKDKSVIEFGTQQTSTGKSFYLKDNGAGFDMKYEAKLFQVFQRLHPNDKFEGTGIGLATVKRVIQRHRGKVWAEAKVDEGATFHFTLEPAEKELT